jgi:excisionase family DNA binding protein
MLEVSMEITVKEASERLRITESQICRIIRQGKIKARRLGYMWLIEADSLDYRRQRKPKGGKK